MEMRMSRSLGERTRYAASELYHLMRSDYTSPAGPDRAEVA